MEQKASNLIKWAAGWWKQNKQEKYYLSASVAEGYTLWLQNANGEAIQITHFIVAENDHKKKDTHPDFNFIFNTTSRT